jgi:hypothetical protein
VTKTDEWADPEAPRGVTGARNGTINGCINLQGVN